MKKWLDKNKQKESSYICIKFEFEEFKKQHKRGNFHELRNHAIDELEKIKKNGDPHVSGNDKLYDMLHYYKDKEVDNNKRENMSYGILLPIEIAIIAVVPNIFESFKEWWLYPSMLMVTMLLLSILLIFIVGGEVVKYKKRASFYCFYKQLIEEYIIKNQNQDIE